MVSMTDITLNLQKFKNDRRHQITDSNFSALDVDLNGRIQKAKD